MRLAQRGSKGTIRLPFRFFTNYRTTLFTVIAYCSLSNSSEFCGFGGVNETGTREKEKKKGKIERKKERKEGRKWDRVDLQLRYVGQNLQLLARKLRLNTRSNNFLD